MAMEVKIQMEVNPLFLLVKMKKIPAYQLAKEIGMSRNTISRLMNVHRMPRNVELKTLDTLAAALGQKVVVSFEPVKENE